ncbi:MAG TPA: hypothetical protein VFZ22_09255 [Pyrinomonadaceae bacterium]|nr:hypothetical protein [Pyrinomonadaceae bacterium]
MNAELLCFACAEQRERGLPVEVESVCEQCFEYLMDNVCDLERAGGKPEISIREEPFDGTLHEFSLPKELGKVIDIAPVNHSRQSTWLVLSDDGKIFRVNVESGEVVQVALSNVPAEPDARIFHDFPLTRRLHASNSGEFVAVVNDYGRYGQIIDLRTGNVTLSLDGGAYHPNTVPFSFAFADIRGSVVAIHRTRWNRLDLSDPATGKLLSEREQTIQQSEEQQRPEHYLDYFHGALYINANQTRILDDGWIWHPLGVPATWSLEPWFASNVWESEDGPTRRDVCARDYYWDQGMTWLGEHTVVIGGIGKQDWLIVDGARIFDLTRNGEPWARDPDKYFPLEVFQFPGPAGKFFSDGTALFSSSEAGLSRWSVEDGARTGHLDGFRCTHHHRGTSELVELKEGVLVRWQMH